MKPWIACAALALLVGCGSSAPMGSTGGSGWSGAGAGGTGGSAAGSGGETATGSGTATASGSGGGGQGGADAGPTWGPDQCPSTPPGAQVGFEIGNQLGDIVVKDCDGNDVSLTTFCGAKALFVFAAYGWCPLCQSVSAQQEALTDSFAGQNLASVNVVVQNGQGQPADATYCKTWRDNHGHNDVVTLYDPTGAVLALWGGGGSSSYSAFIDAERIVVSKLVHTGDQAAITAGIQGALDH